MLTIRLPLHPEHLNAFYLISQKKLPFIFKPRIVLIYGERQESFESWLFISHPCIPFPVLSLPPHSVKDLRRIYARENLPELVIKKGEGERKSLTFSTIFVWPLEEKLVLII